MEFIKNYWKNISLLGIFIILWGIEQIFGEVISQFFFSICPIKEDKMIDFLPKIFPSIIVIFIAYQSFIFGKNYYAFSRPIRHIKKFIKKRVAEGKTILESSGLPSGDIDTIKYEAELKQLERLYKWWNYSVVESLKHPLKPQYYSNYIFPISKTPPAHIELRLKLQEDLKELYVVGQIITSDWIVDGYNPANLQEY